MARSLFSCVKSRYTAMSYQNKLVISIFTIILVPIIFLTVYSYYKNISILKLNALELTKLYLDQVSESIDADLGELTDTALFLSRNKIVTRIIERSPDSMSVSEQIADLRDLDVLTSSYSENTSIYNIRIYVNSAYIYSKRDVITYDYGDISPGQLQSIMASHGTGYIQKPAQFTYVGNDTKRVISIMIPVRSSTDYEKVVSIISVDMLEANLIGQMKVAAYTGNSAILITDDQDREVIRHPADLKSAPAEIGALIRSKGNGAGVFVAGDAIIGATPLSNGWKLILVVPMRDIFSARSDFRFQFMILVVLSMLSVYVVAKFYARRNALRINTLAKQIRKVESGELDIKCIVDSEDEIGMLQTSFNYMVDEIRGLMNRQYELGRELNLMELNVLQSQINPHFLYNTLDLVLWAAKQNNIAQVCDAVIGLSRYYRISLSNGSDYIDIVDEVEHARLYVELQNLRLHNKIRLDTHIDDSAMHVKVMKFLLQPIVENSIHHGILGAGRESGEIVISVHMLEGKIRFVIRDNGSGMDRNIISYLMVFDQMPDVPGYIGGYGLKNIIRRLRLYYGRSASITIESTAGEGTQVTIEITAERKP